jgi:hypothetical protein
MKFGIGVLDEKSSKREFRENRLSDIRRLECGHVSSGSSCRRSEGTMGLRHQMSFFMDCLNLDTCRHKSPNDTASHQGRLGPAGTPS